MVLCTQIKGNNLIKQKTTTTIQNHPKKNKEKSIEKKADDEPFHRQEVKIL
jgi:hypothetical protein